MRPSRLELHGFSTFRDRVTLDLDGLDLVAFTGATGAGKSTLIDAMTFALYGAVARYDNNNRVAPVIHQLSVEAKVRLDFELGGRTYIATRVVRRRGTKGGERESATTKEARLEVVDRPPTDEADIETTVLAGDVRELNRAIEELLGLDFRQFTRTIVLPQGDFAAFLRDDRADRDKLLQRLLDLGIYEQMGRLARRAATKARQQAEILIEQRDRQPPINDDDLAKLKAVVEEQAQGRAAAETVAVELRTLDAQLDPLRSRVTTIDAATEMLTTIDVPAELGEIDARFEAATGELANYESRAETARIERDRVAAQLDELPDKAHLVRTQSVVDQLSTARTDVKQLKAQRDDLISTVASLGQERQSSDAALGQAEEQARLARLSADASGWRRELTIGEPCPVCDQDVTEIPEHDSAEVATEAETVRRKLEDRARSVSRKLAKAEGREQATRAELERQAERIDLLELQLTASPVVPDPDALDEQLDRIEAAEKALQQATDDVAELERRVTESREQIRSIEAGYRALVADLAALRDRLAHLGPPVLGHKSLNEDHATIVAWAERRMAELIDERQTISDEGKKIAQARVDLVERLIDAAATAGIKDLAPADLDRLPGLLADANAAARAAVAAAEERRAEQVELGARIEELERSGAVDDTLGRHLRSGGFSSWLLAEALDNIVDKATVWLLELSNQQYSLTAGDRNFAIIDHNNADEQRDVRTLSGGETFLASLALALALADSIAELAPVDAPRLGSMFLDEGFGTLDPGTLDVVASAIEELASTGRMIGIVTHVDDLAERMPARFEVSKGPTTSSVELIGR